MKSDANLLEALKLSHSLSYMLKQNIDHVARIRELEAEVQKAFWWSAEFTHVVHNGWVQKASEDYKAIKEGENNE